MRFEAPRASGRNVMQLQGKVDATSRLILAGLGILSLCLGVVPAEAVFERPGSGDAPTRVEVLVYVLDVDAVHTAGQSFDANVFYLFRWRDERLAPSDGKRRVLPLDRVWHPNFQLLNQQKVWSTFPELVEVLEGGWVIYRQRVWGAFSQPMDLRDFPFDRQTFSVQLVAAGNSPDEVEVVVSPESGIPGKLSVADWRVVGSRAKPFTFRFPGVSRGMAGYVFSFDAARRTGYFVIKVILPLVLIVAMSWIVFWIDPREAGTQISVAITSMLTLIAYRFAVGANLPQVSYLTRLDYFIMASTVLVYLILVHVIATSSIAKSGRYDTAVAVDRVSRCFFPLVFIVTAYFAFFR